MSVNSVSTCKTFGQSWRELRAQSPELVTLPLWGGASQASWLELSSANTQPREHDNSVACCSLSLNLPVTCEGGVHSMHVWCAVSKMPRDVKGYGEFKQDAPYGVDMH